MKTTISNAGLIVLFVCFLVTVKVEAAGKEVAAFSLTQNDQRVGAIRFYSNPDGGSGYVIVENTTTEKLAFSIKVILKTGATRKVYTKVEGGAKSGKASFLHAGTKKDGIKDIEINSIKSVN